MTTNSPNPVDGDVQALIADCEREIADLEKALTTWGETWSPYLQSKLKRQKIALAALTAEPFEYLTWHQGCRAPDDCEIYSTVAEKGDKSDDGSDAIPVYTSPPAQLLRPVELPESQRLNATAQPVSDGLIPVPDEFLYADQNEKGLFELSEDCMCRLSVALSQQSRGLVVKPGYALLPIEPTEEMLAAGSATDGGLYCIWKDMLAAAPGGQDG